ncbi:pseudouridine synthase [Devosia sp. Root105]|uniref:pseudouridine synthase n=1 Tax=Devosia sp. Root105 TaxID=1736423 RepID=UPI0009E9223D|nr:pseudouridine synthase [Devosia sp. Root105]
MSNVSAVPTDGDRLAKVIARSGLCSRRDAEGWIKDGRVTVNGKKVLTPAFNVSEKDKIKVDGEPLAARQGTRVWLYHKPAGLVVTEKDPEGRPTVFEALEEKELPRVVSIGRLDINTEGLLLVTNDGGLKRVLELPATGWLRRYRVRAFGSVTQAQLDTLKDGIEIEGIQYGPIEAILERAQGSNSWLVLSLREGKNREVKNVLGALGLQVNRLIRVSYGPFQLGDLPEGEVEVVAARVLREQLGKRLAAEANTDFDSDMPEVAPKKKPAVNPKLRAAAPGKELKKDSPRKSRDSKFRFEDDETEAAAAAALAERPRQDRPGRFDKKPVKAPSRPRPVDPSEIRTIHFEDGREAEIRVKPPRREGVEGEERKRWNDPEDSSARNFGRPAHHEDRPARAPGAKRPGADADRPKRAYGDKPAGKRPYGDKPRGDVGDRPKRAYGDKPAYGEKRAYGDKSRSARPAGDRPYGDKKPYAPRGDGPARSYEGKKPYAPRTDASDRPSRSFGDKKPYGARPPREGAERGPRDGAERGPRAEEKRPYAPRNSNTGDRERSNSRPLGDKKPYGTRPPRGDRPSSDRPPGGGDRPARSFGDKPRSFGDKKPFSGKPGGTGGKPYGKPSGGAGRPSGGGRPGGAGRPQGGAGRPSGRPAGDRPRGPKKPRE